MTAPNANHLVVLYLVVCDHLHTDRADKVVGLISSSDRGVEITKQNNVSIRLTCLKYLAKNYVK